MIFSKPNKSIPVLQLRINNANIDEVQSFNFLGLQLCSDIAWNLHIDEISKKISRIIGKYILKKATTCSAEECTFDNLQYLDFTSHKLLFVSLGQQIWKDFATTEKGN